MFTAVVVLHTRYAVTAVHLQALTHILRVTFSVTTVTSLHFNAKTQRRKVAIFPLLCVLGLSVSASLRFMAVLSQSPKK